MTKFKVGDRVAFYSGSRRIGTIIATDKPRFYAGPIAIKTNDSVAFVHTKQCRKLKKKVKRVPMEIWIQCLQERPRFICHRDDVNAILFREVL